MAADSTSGPDPGDAIGRCRLSTGRLVAAEWHALADHHGLDLVDVITEVLTTTTTRALPPSWSGDYDRTRATAWIEERDTESPTLLVVEVDTARAVGLVILHGSGADAGPGPVEVRLGYVLAEAAWGRGLATELVAALVDWARSTPGITSLSGGVAAGNEASARVLLRNGFEPAEVTAGGERNFRLEVPNASPEGRASTS